jgi:hypothetical protein
LILPSCGAILFEPRGDSLPVARDYLVVIDTHVQFAVNRIFRPEIA